MAQIGWRDAVITVLKERGEAMHYKEIAEEIEARKLRKNLGATPWNTVYTVIYDTMKSENADVRILKTNPGVFMLADTEDEQRTATFQKSRPSESPARQSIVQCVGMYWHHDKVVWKTKPRLLGQQQQGASEIDFGDQFGIYLLHDRSRVIYVGRSTDRPLGVRLSEHTRDRLNGRWDRFSWFGLKGVNDAGHLTQPNFDATQAQIIALMEAVLIEALEPPQNRKRGDDFSEVEYLQVPDSEKQNRKKKALIEMLSREMDHD